jgi:hypothetical protein
MASVCSSGWRRPPCFSFSLVPDSPWGKGWVINRIITDERGQMRLAGITGDDKIAMIA